MGVSFHGDAVLCDQFACNSPRRSVLGASQPATPTNTPGTQDTPTGTPTNSQDATPLSRSKEKKRKWTVREMVRSA